MRQQGWLFRPEVVERLGLGGLGVAATLLHLGALEGVWEGGDVTVEVSLRQLQRLTGGSRPALRRILRAGNDSCWEIDEGSAQQPIRVRIRWADRALGVGRNLPTVVGRNLPSGGAKSTHGGSKSTPPTSRTSSPDSPDIASGARSSFEWEKAEALMHEIGINTATRRRLKACPLSDLEIYAILVDTHGKVRADVLKRPPGAYAWGSVKKILQERR